jgi:hypothetical protein
MAEGGPLNTQVLRFDGNDESKYQGWSKWARGRLRKLSKAGLEDDQLGNELLLMVVPNSLAWDAVKDIPDLDIDSEDGVNLLWAALDGRFPKPTDADEVGETLDVVFDSKPEAGEKTSSFTGKMRQKFSKCKGLKPDPVIFSPEAEGYLLMRFARLDGGQRAMTLALSKGSYKFADIASSMRTMYPDKLPTHNKSSAFLAEEEEMTRAGVGAGESNNPISTLIGDGEPSGASSSSTENLDDVVTTLIADADEERAIFLVDNLLDENNSSSYVVEEEEFIWALVAWKKARDSLNRTKLARKFPSLGDGKKPNLAGGLKRVRCWNCQQIGHISKDCDKPKRTDTRKKGSGKGKR